MSSRRLPEDVTSAIRVLSPEHLERSAQELQADKGKLNDARRLDLEIGVGLDGARARALDRVLARDLVQANELTRYLAQSEEVTLDIVRARDFVLGLADAPGDDLADALDLALAGDLASEGGIAFDAELIQVVSGWAEEELSASERRTLAKTADLGKGYALYLLLVWSRYVAIAWAISVPDETTIESRVALERLTPDATIQSAAVLEVFTTPIQQFIDDETQPLDPASESFLRAELELIRSQHRVVEGADPFYVRRAIGRIVARLLQLNLVGSHARSLLEDLGAEPSEIVDEILDEMNAGLGLLAEKFCDGSLDPTIDAKAAAQPLIESAKIGEEMEQAALKDPDLFDKAKEKLVLEAAGTAGKAAGVAGSSFVATLALGLMGVPGVDAAVLWLIETLPTLLELYTAKSLPDAQSAE